LAGVGGGGLRKLSEGDALWAERPRRGEEGGGDERAGAGAEQAQGLTFFFLLDLTCIFVFRDWI